MRRLSRGRYSVRLHVLAEPPFDDREGDWIIEAYARRLEQEIRSSPADWLWVHNKWKYPKPSETTDQQTPDPAPIVRNVDSRL